MGFSRMGRKLLLTLALGVLGAVVVASTGIASGGPVDSSQTGVSVNLPGGQNLTPRQPPPPCPTGQDDDRGGPLGLQDPGCAGPPRNERADPAPRAPPS